MSSIRRIHRLQSTSHFPSDLGHKDQEWRVNNQPRTRADSAQSNGLATHMARYPSKIDVRAVKLGPSQGGRKNGQEAKSRTLLGAIFARFKRTAANNGEQLAAAHAKIDQLQQDISVLQKRFADLEGTGYSPYASYQSSAVDIIQGLQRPDVAISQSSGCPTEDHEFEHAATDLVVQVPARAEVHAQAEGVDPLIQPHTTRRAAKDVSSSPTLKQNKSVVSLTTLDTAAPEPADCVEGLSATDKMPDFQPSHTYQHKLPRKKKEDKELDTELEVRPGYIDQERFPRKQVNEELGVESLPSHVRQERLPRKKENEEKGGGRSS